MDQSRQAKAVKCFPDTVSGNDAEGIVSRSSQRGISSEESTVIIYFPCANFMQKLSNLPTEEKMIQLSYKEQICDGRENKDIEVSM